jgi:hypothetical protein
MKTMLSTLIFVSVASITFAQGHLTFKGVPIDGTLSAFVAQLESNGFKLMDTRNPDIPWGELLSGDFSSLDEERPFDRAEILKDGNATLAGDFAGYKDGKIGISVVEGHDLVSSVKVSFPDHYDWTPLESDYITLGNMLTKKYGSPAKNVAAWEDEIPSDNDDKAHAARMGKCMYETVFETNEGTITLGIDDDIWNAFVTLTYTDKINSRRLKAKALGDL